MVNVKLNLTIEFAADSDNTARFRAGGLKQAIKDELERGRSGASTGVARGSVKIKFGAAEHSALSEHFIALSDR